METDHAASPWRLVEGTVNTSAEHFEITYEDAPLPVALIARDSGRFFTVQFEEVNRSQTGATKIRSQTGATKIRKEVRKEIKYYLVELGEPDPWAYAIYHCETMANAYSSVHWAYVPARTDRF